MAAVFVYEKLDNNKTKTSRLNIYILFLLIKVVQVIFNGNKDDTAKTNDFVVKGKTVISYAGINYRADVSLTYTRGTRLPILQVIS
jgi:hypothetical protein